MADKGRDVEEGLQRLREKVKKLAGELEENEAVEALEEAVAEVERFEEKLEGS